MYVSLREQSISEAVPVLHFKASADCHVSEDATRKKVISIVENIFYCLWFLIADFTNVDVFLSVCIL